MVINIRRLAQSILKSRIKSCISRNTPRKFRQKGVWVGTSTLTELRDSQKQPHFNVKIES